MIKELFYEIITKAYCYSWRASFCPIHTLFFFWFHRFCINQQFHRCSLNPFQWLHFEQGSAISLLIYYWFRKETFLIHFYDYLPLLPRFKTYFCYFSFLPQAFSSLIPVILAFFPFNLVLSFSLLIPLTALYLQWPLSFQFHINRQGWAYKHLK